MHRYDTLSWARKLYIQPQAMAHDRYLYDPTTNEWTVDRYLADLNTRYGGIDAILLCVLHAKRNFPPHLTFFFLLFILGPTYPNIGVDDRNQFDLVRGMGGGDSLASMVEAFHQAGVKVLFP